jgi:hypothetical protein
VSTPRACRGSVVTATSTTRSPMVTVYAGRECLGFVLNCGPLGFEAIAADGATSRGMFPSRSEAADALAGNGEQL